MKWTNRRQMILKQIIASVDTAESLGLKIIKDKLIAQVSINHGSSRRKVLEYLKTLIDSNILKETWDSNGTYIERVKIAQHLDL